MKSIHKPHLLLCCGGDTTDVVPAGHIQHVGPGFSEHDVHGERIGRGQSLIHIVRHFTRFQRLHVAAETSPFRHGDLKLRLLSRRTQGWNNNQTAQLVFYGDD